MSSEHDYPILATSGHFEPDAERLAADVIAIRFDHEWLNIEPGSFRLGPSCFTCRTGSRVIIGRISEVAALGFEDRS